MRRQSFGPPSPHCHSWLTIPKHFRRSHFKRLAPDSHAPLSLPPSWLVPSSPDILEKLPRREPVFTEPNKPSPSAPPPSLKRKVFVGLRGPGKFFVFRFLAASFKRTYAYRSLENSLPSQRLGSSKDLPPFVRARLRLKVALEEQTPSFGRSCHWFEQRPQTSISTAQLSLGSGSLFPKAEPLPWPANPPFSPCPMFFYKLPPPSAPSPQKEQVHTTKPRIPHQLAHYLAISLF